MTGSSTGILSPISDLLKESVDPCKMTVNFSLSDQNSFNAKVESLLEVHLLLFST